MADMVMLPANPARATAPAIGPAQYSPKGVAHHSSIPSSMVLSAPLMVAVWWFWWGAIGSSDEAVFRQRLRAAGLLTGLIPLVHTHTFLDTVGMGICLLVAISIMLFRMVNGDPPGGDITKLEGTRLVIGLAGNFILGMLMTLGIGLYAPCMILISMLGMNITAAFPVMMGSCAFLMPVASGNFIKLKAYDARASMGLLLGGIPGVLLSAYVIKSLPLTALKWLVVVVVTYTAISMLVSAYKERTAAGNAPAGAH